MGVKGTAGLTSGASPQLAFHAYPCLQQHTCALACCMLVSAAAFSASARVVLASRASRTATALAYMVRASYSSDCTAQHTQHSTRSTVTSDLVVAESASIVMSCLGQAASKHHHHCARQQVRQVSSNQTNLAECDHSACGDWHGRGVHAEMTGHVLHAILQRLTCRSAFCADSALTLSSILSNSPWSSRTRTCCSCRHNQWSRHAQQQLSVLLCDATHPPMPVARLHMIKS